MLRENLSIISWNVTGKCNLRCGHCYLPARFVPSVAGDAAAADGADELDNAQALRLIDQIALVNPETMLILSGGEPLLRRDIYELASHARHKGMMVVAGTNGTLVDEAAARRMKESGISGVSIGLDSATAEIHDGVRAFPGAWAAAVNAARLCKSQGLSVQINTVVTSRNLAGIPALIEFAEELGAKVFSPFFLVCTGRAEELTDITAGQYEEVLSFIAGLGGNHLEMMIRTRCAPTMRRILHQRNPGSPLLQMDTGRCLAGHTYCRITPDGTVTACPYLPLPLGNVRTSDFGDIWKTSPVLESLRTAEGALKGKCGACEYRLLCGGCRAKAYSLKNDYLGEDPWCAYSPAGGDVIKPPRLAAEDAADAGARPRWSEEAMERLGRVPFFVRSMVKAAVERYAAERGCNEITPEMMEELKSRVRRPAMDGH